MIIVFLALGLVFFYFVVYALMIATCVIMVLGTALYTFLSPLVRSKTP